MPDGLPTDSPWVASVIVMVLTLAVRDGVPQLMAFFKQRSADQIVQADLASKGYVAVIAELKAQQERDAHRISELQQENCEQEQEMDRLRSAERDCAMKQSATSIELQHTRDTVAQLTKTIDQLTAKLNPPMPPPRSAG